MAEPIRRCRPPRNRDCDLDVDPLELPGLLNRNRLLGAEGALVAYELARRVLTVDTLEALVDAGQAVKTVDPHSGMAVYSSSPEFWVR